MLKWTDIGYTRRIHKTICTPLSKEILNYWVDACDLTPQPQGCCFHYEQLKSLRAPFWPAFNIPRSSGWIWKRWLAFRIKIVSTDVPTTVLLMYALVTSPKVILCWRVIFYLDFTAYFCASGQTKPTSSTTVDLRVPSGKRHYPFSKLNLYLLSDFQVFKRRCTYSNSRPFPALKRRRNSLKEKHQTHLGSVLRHRVGVWVVLCGAGGWNWQSLWIPFNLGYSMIHLIIWLQELRHSLQNLARLSTQESRSVPIKRKGQEWKKQRQPSNIKRWIRKELDS